jgi:hypothetical protein
MTDNKATPGSESYKLPDLSSAPWLGPGGEIPEELRPGVERLLQSVHDPDGVISAFGNIPQSV